MADLVASLEATIPFVDEYVLYELHDRRGRPRGQVPQLLRSRVPKRARCVMARDQAEALRKGWKRVGPGDRLMLVIDEVDEALELVQRLLESSTKDSTCEAPIQRDRVVDAEPSART